jgi:hypothetical protein
MDEPLTTRGIKMCKNLVDEMVVLGKEGWLVEKMKGRYV